MKIVIGLIEHIGDIVATEPVARYLRLKHPAARVSWVVGKPFRELVEENPHIDETIVVDCLTDWMKLVGHQSYELVVDLHVNYRICPCCQIPLIKERGNPFVSVYEWLDYGPLLTAFSIGAGLPPLAAQPKVYIKEKHRAAVDALDLPSRFCVFHRQSNSINKHWSEEKWCALSSFIQNNYDLTIVEVGAGSGNDPLDGRYIDLIGKCSLLETAEVIRRALFFVGVDSAGSHFANALKVPGVILLGQLMYFDKYNPFTGFYGTVSPWVKLVRNLIGSVSDIPVDDVCSAVRYVAEAAKQPVPGLAVNDRHALFVTAEGRSLIRKSGLFDSAWYTLHTPGLEESGEDPLEHYLATGGLYSETPLPDFDAQWYLNRYPDVREAGTHPLAHYLVQGNLESREKRAWRVSEHGGSWGISNHTSNNLHCGPTPEIGDRNRKELSSTLNLPSDGGALQACSADEFPRVFAFYLPQFHPIAENDWAHGRGFTEWHNVIRAEPLFKGHYQPKVPGELGFYDLRSAEVLWEQAKLARQHGIDGFCFYYYYFEGKRILHTPIDNYIQSSIDAPFMLMWANENWSCQWDGGDREVIIEQHHSEFDDREFIRGLLQIFSDKRYVKICGKPVLIIYKAHLFPDVSSTCARWRREAEAAGFPGLYLIMVDDWGAPLDHPRHLGFDATYEIPSNVMPSNLELHPSDFEELAEDFDGRIIDYQRFAQFHAGRPFPKYKRFRTVMLPWDNTARYGRKAIVHVNTDGDGYKTWLSQAILDTYKRYPKEERLVFVHSWNEWCEGTYLEPDGKHGRRLLEQTQQAIGEIRSAIAMHLAGHRGVDVWSLFNRIQREKDIGAFRALMAARRRPVEFTPRSTAFMHR